MIPYCVSRPKDIERLIAVQKFSSLSCTLALYFIIEILPSCIYNHIEKGTRRKRRPGPEAQYQSLSSRLCSLGLILGAGIYVLIGDVAGIAGNAIWISFIISAIIATFTGLSYAELTSMFPRVLQEYVSVKNAFDNDLGSLHSRVANNVHFVH